eukprot:COSAG01_NODE_6197_length_3796_cov_1.700811_5_plen_137_part_00
MGARLASRGALDAHVGWSAASLCRGARRLRWHVLQADAQRFLLALLLRHAGDLIRRSSRRRHFQGISIPAAEVPHGIPHNAWRIRAAVPAYPSCLVGWICVVLLARLLYSRPTGANISHHLITSAGMYAGCAPRAC